MCLLRIFQWKSLKTCTALQHRCHLFGFSVPKGHRKTKTKLIYCLKNKLYLVCFAVVKDWVRGRMEQLSRGDSDKNAITLKGLLCGYETFGNSFCIPSSQSWAVAPTKCFLRIKVNSFPNLIHYSVTEVIDTHTVLFLCFLFSHLWFFDCRISFAFHMSYYQNFSEAFRSNLSNANAQHGNGNKMKVDVNENWWNQLNNQHENERYFSHSHR